MIKQRRIRQAPVLVGSVPELRYLRAEAGNPSIGRCSEVLIDSEVPDVADTGHVPGTYLEAVPRKSKRESFAVF